MATSAAELLPPAYVATSAVLYPAPPYLVELATANT
jgi:hypothetical protein